MRQSTILARITAPRTMPPTRSQRCQISMRALFDGQACAPQPGRGRFGAKPAHPRHDLADTLAAGGGWNPVSPPGWGVACEIVVAARMGQSAVESERQRLAP